jgi:hypothetical protein
VHVMNDDKMQLIGMNQEWRCFKGMIGDASANASRERKKQNSKSMSNIHGFNKLKDQEPNSDDEQEKQQYFAGGEKSGYFITRLNGIAS